jgi:hypothetical protein
VLFGPDADAGPAPDADPGSGVMMTRFLARRLEGSSESMGLGEGAAASRIARGVAK